jgi:hypothetical protein
LASAETFRTPLKPLPVSEAALQQDLEKIAAEAKLAPGSLSFTLTTGGPQNTVRISCQKGRYHLEVKASAEEKVSTLYKGLRELGFLFPHPMRQISPSPERMRAACGKSIAWRPSLPIRGFHFHTLHPNEWVHAFFMNKPEIGEATIRWLARNGQNSMDLVLVRMPLEELTRQIKPQFELARSLGIHTGVSIGMAMQQQKIYRLLNLWNAFIATDSDVVLEREFKKLLAALPLSFITMKPGTSEFTGTDYAKKLRWLNLSGKIAREHEVALFIKVHVSVNMVSEKWGNYNFLPQYADTTVGVWPHTVFFYGLLDEKAPIYSNKDFSDMRNFMLRESKKRPTWYYPETSYWIGMDMDLPLLLTDYLYTRSQDYRLLYEQGIEGHQNFTTGHALGGWLLDWNVALMADLDYDFSPTAAVRLLGEPEAVWQKHISFQHEWFKRRGLIAALSAANLQDELSEKERIHARFTMKQLRNYREHVQSEIALLEEALPLWPSFDEVKDGELRDLFQITKLRHQHALHLRHALLEPRHKKEQLRKAKAFRREANGLTQKIARLDTSYPGLPIFEKHKNPTSYQFGYAYPAASSYFWRREERQIERDYFFPFAGNMYDVWNIIF